MYCLEAFWILDRKFACILSGRIWTFPHPQVGCLTHISRGQLVLLIWILDTSKDVAREREIENLCASIYSPIVPPPLFPPYLPRGLTEIIRRETITHDIFWWRIPRGYFWFGTWQGLSYLCIS